ncbi:MAG: hypothetical protein INH37_21680, partial [Myxococcaceae bacterium]|nr:hypothetical protein [Myxococcaceae bacterium]
VEALDQLVREFFTHDWPTSHARRPVDGVFGVSSGAQGWTVRLAGGAATVDDGLADDVTEVLQLAPAELLNVLVGALSWEDVWYGYRLHVSKRRDVGYARGFWEMLLGIEADLVRARRAAR